MRVSKWGNSLAVRLATAAVEALRPKKGDMHIHVAGPREFHIAREPRRQDFLNRLRAYRGRLPRGFKFDREEANAR
jgi:antitoxin MazE